MNNDPRFQIFTPGELPRAVEILTDAAKSNGGIVTDYTFESPPEYITLFRKMKHVGLIKPTGKKLFEYKINIKF